MRGTIWNAVAARSMQQRMQRPSEGNKRRRDRVRKTITRKAVKDRPAESCQGANEKDKGEERDQGESKREDREREA
jgi:hypothetical protein